MNFYEAWVLFFHMSLGISQSSSTTTLLWKWTTMKRDVYNELRWKSGRVFSPETVPKKSAKYMFSGPTNITKLKLKAPKSSTKRRNLHTAWCQNRFSKYIYSFFFLTVSLKLQFDFGSLPSTFNFVFFFSFFSFFCLFSCYWLWHWLKEHMLLYLLQDPTMILWPRLYWCSWPTAEAYFRTDIQCTVVSRHHLRKLATRWVTRPVANAVRG